MTTSEQTLMSVAEAIESRWSANGASSWEIANLAVAAYQQSAEMRALVKTLMAIASGMVAPEDCRAVADKALTPFTKESPCADT